MSDNKRKSLHLFIGIGTGVLVLLFVGVSVFALKLITRDEMPRVQQRVQRIRLINSPPPRIREKLPEPLVQKKEEIMKQEIEQIPPDQIQEEMQDKMPSDDLLGLDADGMEGSDSFGLSAKKGGRAIILGDGNPLQNLKKFAWYTRIVENDIKRHIAGVDGLPSKRTEVLVKIVLDDRGGIVEHMIYQTSGNRRLDEAVNLALNKTQMISEPPPDGMPLTLRIRISVS